MTRRLHTMSLPCPAVARACAVLVAAFSLALSGLPITPLPGANAAQRAAVVPMAAAKPAGPATPTLGPSPYECLTVCSGYGSTLEASSLASVSVMPKLVHVGQVVTARITQNAPKQAVLGYRWELNDLPAGAAGAAALVKEIKGCGLQDLTCSWKVTRWYATTKGSLGSWLIVTVGIANSAGPAETQDYYGVVGQSVHVVAGVVRDAQGTPLAGVPLDITGGKSYRVMTDTNGLYTALLPTGHYVVRPRVEDLLERTESTHPGQVFTALTTDATANFTLDPCGKGRCATAYDWSMPDRFGATNANGLIDYPSLVSDQASGTYQIVPASWPVAFDLNVNGKCPADTSPYRWVWQVTELSHATKTPLVADTGAFTGPIGDQCEFDHTFPELGVYRVTTTTYKQISPGVYAYAGTHTQQVNVRDYLIVGLGDSIASGDGAPDIKASPVQGGAAAMWEYAGCRRSANSYQAQAALALEQADPHTSVTFLHLACAGAAVNSYSAGMYGSAGGIPQQPLSYQLSVMSGSIGGRVPDALIISIGENDIGFWDALYFCAEKPSWAYRPHASSDCFAVPYPFQTSKASLGKVVQQATTKTLPADYAQLHLDLKAAGIPADRVYLVEYPDPLSAINAKPSKQDNLVDNAEARWLSQVVQGVNKQARLAATRYGWHYIGGIFSGFAGHGYLAPANTRWVEGSVDSLEAQGAVSGALHPNAKGYAFMAGKVAPALLQNFYPGGKVG